MWKQGLIETDRGIFEYFTAGQGDPLAITHLYMAFDERGNLFATPFTDHYRVYLINTRGAGHSVKAENESQLSMKEAIKDLEAIRTALRIEKWALQVVQQQAKNTLDTRIASIVQKTSVFHE